MALHSSKVLLYQALSTTSSIKPSVLHDLPEKGFFRSIVPLKLSRLLQISTSWMRSSAYSLKQTIPYNLCCISLPSAVLYAVTGRTFQSNCKCLWYSTLKMVFQMFQKRTLLRSCSGCMQLMCFYNLWEDPLYHMMWNIGFITNESELYHEKFSFKNGLLI